MKEQWYLILIVLPFMFLGSIGDMAVPLFVGWVVDAMKLEDRGEVQRLIKWWAVFLAAGALCSFANKMLFGYMSERIGRSVRTRLFKANIEKDVTFFDTRKKGDLISRLSSDTVILQEGLS